MKLIVQIPALNEAETIAEVVSHIPRQISGIDVVEVLLIDDGSTDNTVAIARAAGTTLRVSLEIDIGLHRGGFSDPAAFAAARNAGRPALVHLITSAEDIAPTRTITGLRAK